MQFKPHSITMKKLAIVVVLSFGFILCANAQYYEDIDSLKTKLENATNLRTRFILLDAIGLNLYYHNGSADTTVKSICDSLIKIGEVLDNDSLLSRAYILLNVYYSYTGNNRLTLKAINKAIYYAKKARYYDALSTAYKEHAIIYKDLGMYEKALEKLIKSKKYLPKTHDVLNYMQPNRLYYNISDVYLRMGNVDSAREYISRAYSVTDKKTDPYGYVRVLHMQGKIYQQQEEFNLAKTCFTDALSFCYTANLYYPLLTVSADYCKMLLQFNEMNEAKLHAIKAMGYAVQIGNKNRIIEISKILKTVYMKTNNKDSMYRFLIISDSIKQILDSERSFTQIYNSVKDDENDERMENELAEKERHNTEHRIEFSGLIIAVLAFVILFLSLTRTIIVNKRVIFFLSNMAFLVLFELIFFLIHEFFAGIRPVFMFAILVLFSSLLFPLHHHLQKLTTDKLVENNKKIRMKVAQRMLNEIKKEEQG